MDVLEGELAIGVGDEEHLVGPGYALRANHRVATIKVGTDELCLIEFVLEPIHEGPDPHHHTDQTDAFYAIEGSVEFQLGGEKVVGRPGSFVAVLPSVEHAFQTGSDGARMLNIHTPSLGFHDRLRGMG